MDKEHLRILEEAHRTGGAVNIIFKKSNIIPDSVGVITEILDLYNNDEPWIELFNGEEGLRYNCRSIERKDSEGKKIFR